MSSRATPFVMPENGIGSVQYIPAREGKNKNPTIAVRVDRVKALSILSNSQDQEVLLGFAVPVHEQKVRSIVFVPNSGR